MKLVSVMDVAGHCFQLFDIQFYLLLIMQFVNVVILIDPLIVYFMHYHSVNSN